MDHLLLLEEKQGLEVKQVHWPAQWQVDPLVFQVMNVHIRADLRCIGSLLRVECQCCI